MEIDFSAVNSDYVTVPAGTYLCKIVDVQSGTTRNGDERVRAYFLEVFKDCFAAFSKIDM